MLSSVICLEDAVADPDLASAQRNVVAQLRAHAASGADTPLLFVRVRHPEQIGQLVRDLGAHAGILTGFVLPKFTESTGAAFLDAVVDAPTDRRLLAMPVLESAEIIHAEHRIS